MQRSTTVCIAHELPCSRAPWQRHCQPQGVMTPHATLQHTLPPQSAATPGRAEYPAKFLPDTPLKQRQKRAAIPPKWHSHRHPMVRILAIDPAALAPCISRPNQQQMYYRWRSTCACACKRACGCVLVCMHARDQVVNAIVCACVHECVQGRECAHAHICE
jgi:hypothetical protein